MRIREENYIGRRKIYRCLCEKGSITADILIAGSIIVFVLIPIFCSVMEGYIVLLKTQSIADAVDITNQSVYYALKAESLSRGNVAFDEDTAFEIYVRIISKNLRLNEDLSPKENSVADARIRIESIAIYTNELPAACPYGKVMTRPTIHSCVTIPVKPVFFGEVIKNITGKEFIELKVHVDSDIPTDN